MVKGSLVTLGAGIIGSAVAVPVTLLNSQSQIIIENFPADKKSEYRDKCQVLVTDTNNKKYLFVCRDGEETSPMTFRFYSGSNEQEPEAVKAKGIKNIGGGVELELELLGDSGAGETKTIQDISSKWANFSENALRECRLIEEGENGAWRLDCETGGGEKEFISSPFTIK
ncbi:hypothetical protein WEN_02250 [Mycoplasma wenyonii str. Massachusetts]|uniref:Uncharacterized protein n=1 Tax=Mycoplasma wenyonii (strain Massachusetts) TaxID=1197325 RepID=I6ZF63_MYCWM|nr:hypothetical protein WEN_02250 [Mycoplasma wenyonii str. Massachusetts]